MCIFYDREFAREGYRHSIRYGIAFYKKNCQIKKTEIDLWLQNGLFNLYSSDVGPFAEYFLSVFSLITSEPQAANRVFLKYPSDKNVIK